jgi:hypothetical protein
MGFSMIGSARDSAANIDKKTPETRFREGVR